MSFTTYLSFLMQSVIDYLMRIGAKSVLRMKWRAVSDETVSVLSLSGNSGMFPRIEVEARIAYFRDMVARMKFYGISFRELGIDPLAFWEMLKKLGRKVRNEIDRAFRANYFGKKILDSYMGILGETLGFVREQAISVVVVPHP